MSTICLPDIIARDQISQLGLPPPYFILEAMKYWRWERPGNEVTQIHVCINTLNTLSHPHCTHTKHSCTPMHTPSHLYIILSDWVSWWEEEEGERGGEPYERGKSSLKSTQWFRVRTLSAARFRSTSVCVKCDGVRGECEV